MAKEYIVRENNTVSQQLFNSYEECVKWARSRITNHRSTGSTIYKALTVVKIEEAPIKVEPYIASKNEEYDISHD